MKKVIVLTILFCGAFAAFSQTDSLLLKEYENKIIENSKLKTDLQTEKQNFSDLSAAYKNDTLILQKQIKALRNEVSSEKEQNANLNEKKIKVERDNLQTKVDSLITVISGQNQIVENKNKQIEDEKANSKITADNAKKEGKEEALATIVNFYKNPLFDYIIKSSSKESVIRDLQLVGDNPEVKPVLNDLQIYFNAHQLLSEKFNTIQIENAQTLLSQIKRQSKLLDVLKENVEYYEDFNTDLIRTIGKLDDLDKSKSAAGSAEIQKLKFNEILTILTDYMYNYYDYPKYPYLSDIMLEIVKRKQPNADADITDLLKKL